EHHYGTESVDPPELKQWIESGRKMVVLDSRTHEEFVRMSIPTGISVPGGELAYRIGDMVPPAKTLALALDRAKRFAEESGVGVIGPLDLERFEEDPDRTLYVLDVRDPAE